MATRKRNEWLEADLSEEEEDQGYDSEAVEESKGNQHAKSSSRNAKRRKLSPGVDESAEEDPSQESERDEEDDHGDDEGADHEGGVLLQSRSKEALEGEEDEEEGKDDTSTSPSTKSRAKNLSADKTTTLKTLTPKQLAASQRAAKKTGVIYLSRIPPFMKPHTLKHLLSPFGDIGRIFLTPEDPAAHTRRVKSGGNKKRSFTDGWVEFIDKKHAKIVAETLNATIIGGKKGGWYHDDVWNIKYLKGFKWHHLTEQISNENAERAARMRADIAQVSRENKLFVRNVERAKMLEGMEAKKKKKLEKAGGVTVGPAGEEGAARGDRDGRHGFKREFRQNEVRVRTAKDRTDTEQPEEVRRVLSKIF
ncbi:MAG: hypothetical protein M1819_001269 [Sarea resinae]|nr:MAG: hypothetical protein M1819_001269 [Sarea resinae]